jgi:hypothetical protein
MKQMSQDMKSVYSMTMTLVIIFLGLLGSLGLLTIISNLGGLR